MFTTAPDDDAAGPPDLYLLRGLRPPADAEAGPDEAPPTAELAGHRERALAAAADLPEDAALSYVSAACLLDLPIWDVPLLNGSVQATRPRPGVAINRAKLTVRAGRLSPDETVRVEGVLVTDVARTLIDLGRWASVATAVVCTDAALRAGSVSPDQLRAALDRACGTGGAPRARIAVGFADGRSGSVAESRARVAARWPRPVAQPRPWGPDEPSDGWAGRSSDDGRPVDRFPAEAPPPDPDEQPRDEWYGSRATPW